MLDNPLTSEFAQNVLRRKAVSCNFTDKDNHILLKIWMMCWKDLVFVIFAMHLCHLQCNRLAEKIVRILESTTLL